MIKLTEIISVQPYQLMFRFSRNEVKLFAMETLLKNGIPHVNTEKLLLPDVFCKAKIGELGQLYWNNVATMKQGNTTIACEYDISPEYVYYNSINIKPND